MDTTVPGHLLQQQGARVEQTVDWQLGIASIPPTWYCADMYNQTFRYDDPTHLSIVRPRQTRRGARPEKTPERRKPQAAWAPHRWKAGAH